MTKLFLYLLGSLSPKMNQSFTDELNHIFGMVFFALRVFFPIQYYNLGRWWEVQGATQLLSAEVKSL